MNQCLSRVAAFFQFGDDLCHDGFVVVFEPASGGIGQHLAGHIDGKFFLGRHEERLELGRRVEGDIAGKNGAGIDRLAVGVFLAPTADGVEVFKAEAKGVDAGMAAGAFGILAVNVELLAKGEAFGLGVIGGKFAGIGWWWWSGIAEESIENPNAAQDRAGAERKRR